MIPHAEVIGDPIAQSKSPIIHGFWLERLGLAGRYDRAHVRPEELAGYLAERRGDPDWRGCNVTIPHKQAVMSLLDAVDPLAAKVGAVNTVVRTAEGALTGYNTDVGGVLAALPESHLRAGDEVCVIGTGGAARAALAALHERNVGIVLISARDDAKGWTLLREFAFGGTVRALDDPHNIQTSNVIINATSLGMQGQSPMPAKLLRNLADPLSRETVVFDMVYAPLETPLLEAARLLGLRTVDGLQMLIGQARIAFRLLFGSEPPDDMASGAELVTRLVG